MVTGLTVEGSLVRGSATGLIIFINPDSSLTFLVYKVA